MARIGVTSILLAFALFTRASIAATLNGERESFVRKEPLSRVHLTADGEMIQEDKAQPKLSPEDEFEDENSFETRNDQFCDDDFPVGLEKTSNCTNANPLVQNEILINEENMCEEAASQSGAHTINGKFKMTQFYEPKRPRGCFKEPCSESSNGVCYYFNAVGYWPTPEEGFPICNRPKHVNGTKNVAGGCPSGYAVVDDEETCRNAANCLRYTQGNEFRIGILNASKHLDYVRGCFLEEDATGLTVYYNPATNLGDCTTCKGTQICNVTSTVTWPTPPTTPPTQ